jgi:hypothetical protein
MRDGEVHTMEVVGQARGWHLEPLGRAPEAAADSLMPADSSRVAPPPPAGLSGPAPADTVRVAPGRRP